MIKLNTSYSKKVPVPGEDYSSQSFHCSMEVELSDKQEAGELRARIHETFAQCRAAVEAEPARRRAGDTTGPAGRGPAARPGAAAAEEAVRIESAISPAT